MRTIRFIFCIVICFISIQAFSQTGDKKTTKEMVIETCEMIELNEMKFSILEQRMKALGTKINKLSKSELEDKGIFLQGRVTIMEEQAEKLSEVRKEGERYIKYVQLSNEMYKLPDFDPKEDEDVIIYSISKAKLYLEKQKDIFMALSKLCGEMEYSL